MAQQKAADGSQRYRGFLHALVTIPREEGLRAMWKGLLPRLMRIPPGQARLQTSFFGEFLGLLHKCLAKLSHS